MLPFYLRNQPYLDTAKGYWVSVSVIGPQRLQKDVQCHTRFQFPVSHPYTQYNHPPPPNNTHTLTHTQLSVLHLFLCFSLFFSFPPTLIKRVLPNPQWGKKKGHSAGSYLEHTISLSSEASLAQNNLKCCAATF